MYNCAMAVLKVCSVSKQDKIYHLQVFVEECRYTDAQSQKSNMLINSDDDA